MGRKRKLNVTKPDTKIRKISEFLFVERNIVENTDICEDIVSDGCRDSVRECETVSYESSSDSASVSETPCGTPSKAATESPRPKLNVIRKFREEWKFNKPWLTYDPKTKSMFCSVCTSASVENSFTTGCNILKKENVTNHVKAKGKSSHTEALKILQASRDYKKSAEIHLSKSESAITAAMKNLFFLSDHSLPNMLISDFNQHCIDQGCSSLKSLKVDNHTTYEHSTSVQEMQECMVDVISDQFLRELGDSKFSIMVDESTDVAIDQNMLIYVRYLEQSLGTYKPKSVLLDVCKIIDGATSSQLKCLVLGSLEDKHLKLDNLVGISTDGASVMTGKKSGLVKQLKDEVPSLLGTHCIAHKLALASGQAADTIPYLLKYQELVNSIYKYFHNSPKNCARLDKIAEVFNASGKCIRFKQVFHTRWLSFEGSVRAICDNYSPLLSVLSEDKGAKAQGLLKSIATFKFLYTSHFLADLLKQLSILCKSFQSSSIDFNSVSSCLEVTTAEVNRLTESKDGKMLKCFKQSVPDSADGSGECEFLGHVIKDSEKQRVEAVSCCQKFGERVLVNLGERFADVGDGKILRGYSALFDPVVFVGAGEVMDESIETVSEHLGEEDFREEYMRFRGEIISTYARVANDVNSVCQLALQKREIYPGVADVAYRLLCIPVSSVECERGFSVQNLIKTKLRNRLDTRSLYLLMKLQIDGGPQQSFDFAAAYGKWKNMKSRRICGF